jgi:zinc transport system substrate-binding protein
MKKFFVFMVTVMLLSAGCAQVTPAAETGQLKVVVTNFPAYDFTGAVVGDLAEVRMLLPVGAEYHSFEPTPQDIIDIQNCDVFIYNGGESEEWVEDILESMPTDINTVRMMDCVLLSEEEIVEGMEDDEEEEEGAETEFDEHVWTSPENAHKIVMSIADKLIDLDPENGETYRDNAVDYTFELARIGVDFTNMVRDATRNTVVFGDRFPFRYLADAYGLEYYAAFPGCSTETEASASTVAFLIDKIEEEDIPVVFHIEFSDGKMTDAISEVTGAKPLLLHSCHNISKEDFDSGLGYTDLMRMNLRNLTEALN